MITDDGKSITITTSEPFINDDGSITHKQIVIDGIDAVKFKKFLARDFMRMDWKSYIDIGVIPENLYWSDDDQKAWDSSQIQILPDAVVRVSIASPFAKPKTEQEPAIADPFKLPN